jgi:DNA-binding MarR family transcriptional regulator
MYVSKLVRAMEHNGLIERGDDPDDSRAVRLSLTDLGIEVLTEARRIVTALDEHMLAPLDGPASRNTARLHDQLLALLHHLDQENPT